MPASCVVAVLALFHDFHHYEKTANIEIIFIIYH